MERRSMGTEIKTIEREDLKAKLDRGDVFKLVMAMHEWGFTAAHIPGSLHFTTVEEAQQGLDVDTRLSSIAAILRVSPASLRTAG